MRHRSVIAAFYFMIALFICKTSLAFEVEVHKEITKSGIDHVRIELNDYLRKIGLNDGIYEILNTNGDKIRDYMEEGSKEEDNGTRWRNHFYNPLNGVGLNDTDTLITGMPSFAWASYGPNEWSWKVARNKYYTGLTATTDNDRRAALAVSFQALGQVTHLVQDLASPAHVRNDAHPTGDGFESYTKRKVNELNYSAYNFANALSSVSQYAPKQFWDSDTYTLQNPNPSSNNTQGLAEYTNANFASDDTIFTENNLTDWNPLNDSHYFPHPAKSETILYNEFMGHSDTFGFDVYRKYYLRNAGGEEIKHFAYAGRLWRYLDGREEQKYALALDDQCYKDYAQKLIPRAVGYSAGLLNYFFRSKVNMEKDPQNAGKYIIKNESGEKMEGTFALLYQPIFFKNMTNVIV